MNHVTPPQYEEVKARIEAAGSWARRARDALDGAADLGELRSLMAEVEKLEVTLHEEEQVINTQ